MERKVIGCKQKTDQQSWKWKQGQNVKFIHLWHNGTSSGAAVGQKSQNVIKSVENLKTQNGNHGAWNEKEELGDCQGLHIREVVT